LTRARREIPIEIYAAEKLSHRFKKVRRKGVKIAELSPDQLHRFRIQVKKLRYALEFFFNLYSGKKLGKRRKKVLSSLTQLQTALGRINDIITHKGLFTEIIADPRRGLTATQNHQRAYAAGLIIGDQQAQIQGLLDRARKAYSRFDNVKPFWILPDQRSAFSQGATITQSGHQTRSG
jgi:CHAD domain-containing protein